MSASIVFVLMLGLIEFSLALYTYHFVASAARQAARYAIVRGADCTSWATACPASASDIQSYVRSITPEGIDPNSVNVTTTWLPNNSPGSEVKVAVQYQFGFDVAFVPSSLLALEGDAEMTIWQ